MIKSGHLGLNGKQWILGLSKAGQVPPKKTKNHIHACPLSGKSRLRQGLCNVGCLAMPTLDEANYLEVSTILPSFTQYKSFTNLMVLMFLWVLQTFILLETKVNMEIKQHWISKKEPIAKLLLLQSSSWNLICYSIGYHQSLPCDPRLGSLTTQSPVFFLFSADASKR